MATKKTKTTENEPVTAKAETAAPVVKETPKSIVVTMNDSGKASTNKVKTTRELYMESE